MNAKVGYCGLRVQAEVHTELNSPLAQILGSVAASMARGGAPSRRRVAPGTAPLSGLLNNPARRRGTRLRLVPAPWGPRAEGLGSSPRNAKLADAAAGPMPPPGGKLLEPAEGQGRCVCTFERMYL